MKSLVDNRLDFAQGEKILGFDMDGVLVDNGPVKRTVLRKLGFSFRLADTPSEIIRRLVPENVLKKMQIALYHDREMSFRAKLMPGIKELLEGLKSKGAGYYLISRRSEPEIAEELRKARGLWPKYFNESNAFFVITPEDKNTKAKELGVTHYVDDETKVLGALSDVPNKFLFDHLNVFPPADHYTKVASHDELAKYFT